MHSVGWDLRVLTFLRAGATNASRFLQIHPNPHLPGILSCIHLLPRLYIAIVLCENCPRAGDWRTPLGLAEIELVFRTAPRLRSCPVCKSLPADILRLPTHPLQLYLPQPEQIPQRWPPKRSRRSPPTPSTRALRL